MDAVKIIRDANWRFDMGDVTIEQYEELLAPLRDVEVVRHGRWIDIDTEMYTWKIRCSKCGHEKSMMSTGQMYSMYCENCGARMDGKDGDHHDKR